MVGFHIRVPRWSCLVMIEFVKLCVPRPEQLFQQIPKNDRMSADDLRILRELCDEYETIPTADQSLRVHDRGGEVEVMQLASGACQELKVLVRRTVHRIIEDHLDHSGVSFKTERI